MALVEAFSRRQAPCPFRGRSEGAGPRKGSSLRRRPLAVWPKTSAGPLGQSPRRLQACLQSIEDRVFLLDLDLDAKNPEPMASEPIG